MIEGINDGMMVGLLIDSGGEEEAGNTIFHVEMTIIKF